MKPGIGRIVHFVDPDGIHLAAIITGVLDVHHVHLTVFPANAGGPFDEQNIDYDDRKVADSWHWPEREE